MCSRLQLVLKKEDLEERYDAVTDNPADLITGEEINAFVHPTLPIITNSTPKIISTEYYWGLVPHWAKDRSIQKNTVNAKIETLHQKPSFHDIIGNRCLIPATAFYEWRWLDEKGKSKEKYSIHSTTSEIFSMAGLYSSWIDPISGETLKTFTMITTEANPTMAYCNNIKKRMPIVLKPSDEQAWLDGSVPYMNFTYPNYDAEVVSFRVG